MIFGWCGVLFLLFILAVAAHKMSASAWLSVLLCIQGIDYIIILSYCHKSWWCWCSLLIHILQYSIVLDKYLIYIYIYIYIRIITVIYLKRFSNVFRCSCGRIQCWIRTARTDWNTRWIPFHSSFFFLFPF